ncbi:hypothetical protein [Microbacterium marmarense]|uniref:Uncharacterized protein n=1 Tax=Microbacterium marmarense TaxID=3122051 RepID=A0ABU8LTG0_9MICO
MILQPHTTIASLLGVATAGVGTLYISLITTFDHSHEQEAVRQNIFVVLLPTWPIIGVALLAVMLFVATVVFSVRALPSPRSEWKRQSSRPAAPDASVATAVQSSPVPGPEVARVIRSPFWTDFDGLRAHRQIPDTRRKVTWISNGIHAGWLLGTPRGTWDVVDHEDVSVGVATTVEEGLGMLKQHLFLN